MPCEGEGEPDGEFPSWSERWLHQLVNRARCDPQVDLADCTVCADKDCYTPIAPLPWSSALNRAARFHSAQMDIIGFMSHTSFCTVVSNIASIYPEPCDGSASCACVGGIAACSPICTSAQTRVGLFGESYRGEIIAPFSDPTVSFYLWLHEPTSNPACQFTMYNGHRWLILRSEGAVGLGVEGDYATGDFAVGSVPSVIPSGSHYPRQAAAVEMWANWYDTNGPTAASVNVAGTCYDMTLGRGSATNGSWMASVSGRETGCHRYYFEFEDSQGATVTYPTTGSLAIGSGPGCPDWHDSRPPPCGIDHVFSDGFETGTTSNWSTVVPS